MNETAVDASTIHGTNPQFLIEKITRLKIYSCLYWKEKCFGLTAETILDRAITLKYFGGCYSGTLKPSPFLCLVLKLLQLQPDKEIIIEFIRNDDFKYLRALGAFYLRLVGKAEDVYRYLEPLYNDYRKLAFRGLGSGSTGWQIKYMDEFIDELLTKEQVCDIALPFLQKRSKLEDLGQLGARKSVLDEEIEFMQNQEDDEDNDDQNENDIVTDNVKGNTIDTNNNDNTIATVGYVVQSSSSSSNLNDKEVTKSSTFATKEKDNITSESYDKDRLKDNKDSDRYRDRDGGRDRDSRDRRSRDRDDRRRSRSRDRSSKYDHDDRRRGLSRSRSKDRYNRRSRSRSKDRYNKHRDKYDDKDYRRRSRSRERDNRRSDDRDKDRYNKYDKNEKSDKSDKSIAVNFDDDEDEDVEVGQVNETKLKEIEKANKKAAKKFDKIFGKKDTAQSSAKSAEQGKVEEGSVEYWNQIRSSLGIKALRE